jgi:hypothetical protein
VGRCGCVDLAPHEASEDIGAFRRCLVHGSAA